MRCVRTASRSLTHNEARNRFAVHVMGRSRGWLAARNVVAVMSAHSLYLNNTPPGKMYFAVNCRLSVQHRVCVLHHASQVIAQAHPPSESSRLVPQQTLVDLNLLLSRSLDLPTSCHSIQVGPHARQPGQLVLRLSQLDLCILAGNNCLWCARGSFFPSRSALQSGTTVCATNAANETQHYDIQDIWTPLSDPMADADATIRRAQQCQPVLPLTSRTRH